jgi:hypothetical protein
MSNCSQTDFSATLLVLNMARRNDSNGHSPSSPIPTSKATTTAPKVHSKSYYCLDESFQDELDNDSSAFSLPLDHGDEENDDEEDDDDDDNNKFDSATHDLLLQAKEFTSFITDNFRCSCCHKKISQWDLYMKTIGITTSVTCVCVRKRVSAISLTWRQLEDKDHLTMFEKCDKTNQARIYSTFSLFDELEESQQPQEAQWSTESSFSNLVEEKLNFYDLDLGLIFAMQSIGM